MTPFAIQRVQASALNDWLVERHYLHRPIIRSKMIAHGVFIDRRLVGGVLWATPHFTKKAGLFGMPGTLDKWEVLMLARFYLEPGADLIASAVLGESIGRGATNSTTKRRRGWRVQQDWVIENPPPFPDSPFVPRLLISWSDRALETVAACPRCGERHEGQHEGIIYQASGWELWDVSASSGQRTGRSFRVEHERERSGGEKKCWILRLPPNMRAQALGRAPEQTSLAFAAD